MKKLVKLTLKNGEEIICIFIKKINNRYIFEKDSFVFNIDEDEIQYIDRIGEIYENNKNKTSA